MSIKHKITAGMATAAMIAGVMAPVAHGATISGNGVGSVNTVAKIKINAKSIQQANATIANTVVKSKANTGKNVSVLNTGGSTTQITGPATSSVVVGVTGGSNTATVADCGCPDDVDTTSITGNGVGSFNTVFKLGVNFTQISQSSVTVANTVVSSSANTGGNVSALNTGGATAQGTGAADSSVGVVVGGGNNDLN